MMDVKIGIAAHKEYRVPSDEIYLPIQVGAAGKDHILAVSKRWEAGKPVVAADVMTGDDGGENISEQNPKYCELTGLYWMWKNLRCEYGGLVHYRRHFADPAAGRLQSQGSADGRQSAVDSQKVPEDGQSFAPTAGDSYSERVFSRVLGRESLEKILARTDIILPKMRNYYIESVYSHYAHSHYAEQLDVTREILKQRCPEYLDCFDRQMKSTKAHMFNMMIMKKDKMDSYCSWLFPILFELDRRIDSGGYDAFQARFPGRVSELLLDVWVDTKGYSYEELPVVMPERVHWGRKIASFLGAKFLGRRYKRGF